MQHAAALWTETLCENSAPVSIWRTHGQNDEEGGEVRENGKEICRGEESQSKEGQVSEGWNHGRSPAYGLAVICGPVTETLFLLWPIVSLVVGVLIVRLAGSITGGLTFDSWGAAFGAVFVAYVVWWVAGYAVAGFFPTPSDAADLNSLITQSLTNAAVQLVFNIVSLAIAGVVISGMQIRGVFGLLVAALALTVFQLAFVYLPSVLATMNA